MYIRGFALGLCELDVADAVLGGRGDGELGEGLLAVPAVPEDDALAVGGDGGDQVGDGRHHPKAAVTAQVGRDQLVVEADAVDRALVRCEEQAIGTQPREQRGGGESAATALLAERGE